MFHLVTLPSIDQLDPRLLPPRVINLLLVVENVHIVAQVVFVFEKSHNSL
jgi:hypothetical protein